MRTVSQRRTAVETVGKMFCMSSIRAEKDAEVHFVNMTALTRGGLHSSFIIVDRKHIYIGSADMDWRSLSKVTTSINNMSLQKKELGVVVYNCSCLALDLHRVFSFYWQLHEKDYIPSIWSKRVTALYGKNNALELQLTHHPCHCLSVLIREAVVLRGVRVRLLISFWKKTHPLTFTLPLLKSLCMQLHNCSLEVRFFSHKEQRDDIQHGLNHNKYMVTDNAVYIGNLDWVGSDFAINAGAGLVVQMENSPKDRGVTILEHIKAAFERDWRSRYAKSLQAAKIIRKVQKPASETHEETKEENGWNSP
ncbi:hypothetical protein INR49_023069, partial [Caranx melampygus]